MSSISVDFPDPLTPVIATNSPSGTSRVTLRRLCSRAPSTRSVRRTSRARRTAGISIRLRPERYCAVIDFGFASTSATVPSAITSPPCFPGAGSEVDQVIGGADRFFVVLDHDHRVAEIAQPHQRREQPRVVALVQPDARLVEDVEHAHEARPDLRGETNALRLAARQRFRAAIQRQVLEPDVHEEAQPLAHFLEHGAGDVGVEPRLAGRAKRNRENEIVRVAHGELAELADVPAGDRHRERLRLEPHPFALGAHGDDHVLLELVAHGVARGLVVAALHVREDPFPLSRRFGIAALLREAVEQDFLHARGELSPGHVELELQLLRERGKDHPAQISVGLAPREHHALEERDARVAEHEFGARRAAGAESAARGAGAEGRVEREVARLELGHRDAAGGAAVLLAEEPASRSCRRCAARAAPARRQGAARSRASP